MNKLWFRDMLERTVSTYVQTLLGLVIASNAGALDVTRLRAAAIAAIPAALAVIKAAFATAKGGTLSPASLADTGG
jgi:Putative lactococcus lactis phage r1t holin